MTPHHHNPEQFYINFSINNHDIGYRTKFSFNFDLESKFYFAKENNDLIFVEKENTDLKQYVLHVCILIHGHIHAAHQRRRRSWEGITPPPLFFNFPLTNLFSIKFLYFFIISSHFLYFNLFVSILIQYYAIVRLTSINLQKIFLKNPVFKSTIFFIDVY